MKQNYTVRLLFPSVMHEYSFEEFNQEELIKFCYEQKEIDPVGQVNSNRGGWHSKYFDIIEENIISKTLRTGLGKSLFTSIDLKLGVTVSYWIMINKPNTYNTSHTHPDSHFSGVMWIKTPKNSGNLVFNNPAEFSGYTELNSYIEEVRDNTSASGTYRYTPEHAKIISFPAALRHEVKVNESDEDRIAVSYNIRISEP